MIDGSPDIYDSDRWLVLDVETTGHYRDKEADLVCLCWADSKGRTGVYKGGSLLPHRVTQKIVSTCVLGGFLVAHNAQFEAGWLQRCGIDTRKLSFWCTMTAEWLLRAGLPAEKGRLSLNGAVKAHGSADVKAEWVNLCIHKGISCKDIPLSSLVRYCRKDVLLTKELFLSQKQKLSTLGANL